MASLGIQKQSGSIATYLRSRWKLLTRKSNSSSNFLSVSITGSLRLLSWALRKSRMVLNAASLSFDSKSFTASLSFQFPFSLIKGFTFSRYDRVSWIRIFFFPSRSISPSNLFDSRIEVLVSKYHWLIHSPRYQQQISANKLTFASVLAFSAAWSCARLRLGPATTTVLGVKPAAVEATLSALMISLLFSAMVATSFGAKKEEIASCNEFILHVVELWDFFDPIWSIKWVHDGM